jgi:hypothetical protein
MMTDHIGLAHDGLGFRLSHDAQVSVMEIAKQCVTGSGFRNTRRLHVLPEGGSKPHFIVVLQC